jgi:lipoyl(octanoyl) transferase
MIRAGADFGIAGKRVEDRHGVWVETPAGEEKLAALGVHLSRWVTSHGFAYNVATDLRYFDLIVPCGIPDKKATSLERLLGRAVSTGEVRPRIVDHFGEVFGCATIPCSPRELENRLGEVSATPHPTTNIGSMNFSQVSSAEEGAA